MRQRYMSRVVFQKRYSSRLWRLSRATWLLTVPVWMGMSVSLVSAVSSTTLHTADMPQGPRIKKKCPHTADMAHVSEINSRVDRGCATAMSRYSHARATGLVGDIFVVFLLHFSLPSPSFSCFFSIFNRSSDPLQTLFIHIQTPPDCDSARH